jgi:DNA-binding beta-propeller fold protein YncE
MLALAADYKVIKTAKVGGAGGFDYVYADSAGRKLYVPRSGNPGRVMVYSLDSLAQEGEIPEAKGVHGAAVSEKTHHGFASSNPVLMWDTRTLKTIKTIDVQGAPDGIMHDPFSDRVYIFSHRAPNVTVINPADGSIAGTIDLGGAPEQGVSDGKGKIYDVIEDKDNIAVIDAKTMQVTGHYDLTGKGGTCAGLALDAKNGILFATCRNPQTMVILKASDGSVITTLPIGNGTDGAVFNARTMEAFSSQRDGTLTVVKESSPTSFAVEETVQTMPSAKTLTLDEKTGHVLLIGAEYGPAAPPKEGEKKGGGRGQMLPDSFTVLVVGK